MSLSRQQQFTTRFKQVMYNMRQNRGIHGPGNAWIDTTRAQVRSLAKKIARSDIREIKRMRMEEETKNEMPSV